MKNMHVNDVITINKAKLVAKENIQAELVDYNETYTHVACLEVIRLLLALTCCLDFKL